MVKNTLVKWPGGKSQLIDFIVPSFISSLKIKDGFYIEPFAGSCAIAFALNHKNTIINDKNIKLINFYRQVKNSPYKLINKINKIISEGDEKEDYYYFIRQKYNKTILSKGNGIIHAAMFWFLNQTCFNGMYREDKNGNFNIPYGKRKCKMPKIENFILTSKKLQHYKIFSKNYKQIISMAKENDWVYLDPPYIPVSFTSSFSSYLRYGFEEKDHIELKNIIQCNAEKGVNIILSNSNSEKTKEIYGDLKGFEFFETKKIQRLISGKNKGRKKLTELIITNVKLTCQNILTS